MRFFSLILFVLLSACSVQPNMPQFNQPDDEVIAQTQALFTDYYLQQQQSSAYLQWPDFSVAENKARLQFYRALEIQLEAIASEHLDADNYLSREVLLHQLKADIAYAEHPEFTLFAESGNGWPLRAVNILLFDTYITSLADVQAYLQRLESLPKLIEQWQEQLTAAQQQQALPANELLNAFQQQLEQVVSQQLLWADFKQKLEGLTLYANSQTLLLKKGQRLINRVNTSLTVAANKLASISSDNTHALSSVAGQRYYHSLLTAYAGPSLGAQQLHQWGQAEVERLNKDINVLLQAFPQGKAPKTVAFNASEINTQAEQAALAFAYVPQTPMALVALKPEQSPKTLPFYQPTDERSERPGLWIFSAAKQVSVTVYAQQLNGPYEHVQWALAQENSALPAFRRAQYLASFNQGWHLFSQQLSSSAVQQQLGALLNEQAAASRLVVDTGLYAEGWDYAQALEYLADHTQLDATQQQAMLNASLANPAYGLAASVQLQQLRSLKASNQAELYSELLAQGPLPYSVLTLWYDLWRK